MEIMCYNWDNYSENVRTGNERLMEKAAERIVNILVREEIISGSMSEIYQYGLVRLFEIGGAVVTGFLICLGMGMLKEGIIFFAFFVPLRSYLGGLHLKKYWQCYIMSCLTLFAVMAITKSVSLDMRVSSGVIVLASIGIGLEAKRGQAEAESGRYAWVVWGVLAILLAAMALSLMWKKESVLVLLCCVTVTVLFSKVCGQILHLPKR